MSTFQERVIEEKKELDEKIARLKAFFDNAIYKTLTEREQMLLRNQLYVMSLYTTILQQRVSLFGS